MLGDDIPVTKRLVQVTASILFCFTIAGLVFGFAALKPILIDSGVYEEYCKDQPAPCKVQDTKLNILFTVASSITNVAALPMGAFLDNVGPKVASIVGGTIFALGCLVFSFQNTSTWFDTYVWGYGLMALGAPAMFLAQFHLSNAFPARSGLILGAVTGAFDASSLPLVFYKLVYFANGGKPTLKTFWLSYMAIPLLLIIYQLVLGPWDVYTRPPKIQITSPQTPLEVPESAIAGDSSFSAISWRRPNKMKSRTSSNFSRRSYAIEEDADDEAVKAGLEGKREDPIVGVMFDAGVWEQIKSSWWLCMFLTVIAQMTRLNWYMATVNAQLVFYTRNPELADTLTDAFIFLLPLGGIVSIPAIGYLLDTRPMKDIVVIMTIMSTAFGILGMVRNTVAQLVGIAILTVFRPLYYTAISDYGAKVFGFHTFGTVYGLAMTLSGLFGLILTPLDILVKGPLHGSYNPVNIVLVIFGLFCSLALYWRVSNPPRIELTDTPRVPANGHTIMEEDED